MLDLLVSKQPVFFAPSCSNPDKGLGWKLAKPSESLAACKDAGNSDEEVQEGISGGKGLAKMVSELEM
jgi:hypothetical protein